MPLRTLILVGFLLLTALIFESVSQSQNYLQPQLDDLATNHSDYYPNFDIRSKQILSSIKPTLDQQWLQLKEIPNAEIRWQAHEPTPRIIYSLSEGLSAPSKLAAEYIARRFLKKHRTFYKVDDSDLKLVANYRSKSSSLRHLIFKQQVGSLEVFGADLKIALDEQGRVMYAASGLMPAAEKLTETQPKLNVQEAVELAAQSIQRSVSEIDCSERLPTLVIFMLTPDEPRLAWRIRLLDKLTGNRYDICIDDVKGSLLLRHSLTWYADQPSYRVFTRNSPQPNMPFLSLNPPLIERELVTTSGDKNASPAGWIDLGNPITEGNNVIAREDRSGNNNGRSARATSLSFDFPLILNTPGEEPEKFTDASITNLFYRCNWTHDYLYKLGFDEQAGNFQRSNFGRGGKENDPVLADAQDGARFNNASFGVSEDGFPSRMQMHLWTTAQPKIDSSFDAEVIIHEYIHGLTTRLVGGPQEATSLFGIQSGGMGEGWSDWYAMSLLSRPGDDPDAKYPFGSYVSRNFERGIRRFPYSTNLEINPLTYADIDPTTTRFNPDDTNSVHRTGEVWALALWTARSEFIKAYGFERGKELIERLVTDALKLTPSNPTFIDGRDAILAADRLTNAGTNECLLWAAFARRGIGFGAAALNGSSNSVRQSFAIAPYCSREGSLLLDRTAYVDGSTIKLQFGDLDLVGQGAVRITISSTSGDTETLMLREHAFIPGLFEGSITTTVSAPNPGDGQLQASIGDTVTASYDTNVTAQARIVREVVLLEDPVNNGKNFVLVSDWKLTKTIYASAPKSLTDSKKGNYPNNANSIVELKSELDFTNTLGSRLIFKHKFSLEKGFDYGYVDVKVGNGLWTPVAAFTGFQAEFADTSVDLSHFDGRKVSVRFRLTSDGGVTADGWYIDDIKVVTGSTKP
ncbi:MAG: M36 family metallopeptidase [Acidobacteriota bacterium]|nr:M36 family metallopeptidase [Blastocatellia bacterium]MDW8412211.1 M36 family metallopeptidase [Acidobacteriota bacterium]